MKLITYQCAICGREKQIMLTISKPPPAHCEYHKGEYPVMEMKSVLTYEEEG